MEIVFIRLMTICQTIYQFDDLSMIGTEVLGVVVPFGRVRQVCLDVVTDARQASRFAVPSPHEPCLGAVQKLAPPSEV